MPVRASDLMALAYLRLAVVDLAFRTAAICWLAKSGLPDEQPPLWARKKSKGLYLRALMKRIGSRRLTTKGRNGLAEQVGVSTQTVDGWRYQGSQPSNTHIDAIANVLTKYLNDTDAQTLAAGLRRHYTLYDIAELLAQHVGWPKVEDLASALIRFASRLLSRLAAFDQSAHPEMVGCQVAIAIEGITAPLPRTWAEWLRDREEDASWKGDITTAVRKDWARWMYELATEITVADEATRFARQELGVHVDDPTQLPKMVADRLRENSGRVPSSPPPCETDPDSAHSKAIRYHDLSLDRAQLGDLEQAIALMRKAIEFESDGAWYHVRLAEMLADTGRVQAAIDECWIAEGLAPDWEQPRVAIGLFLNNAQRFQEARDHLEATANHLAKRTLNLEFNLGIAYLGCGEPQRALKEFEAVLQEKPDQGMALDLMARCCFLEGNHVEGLRKAKEANKLGYTATYDDATAGVFRK